MFKKELIGSKVV